VTTLIITSTSSLVNNVTVLIFGFPAIFYKWGTHQLS